MQKGLGWKKSQGAGKRRSFPCRIFWKPSGKKPACERPPTRALGGASDETSDAIRKLKSLGQRPRKLFFRRVCRSFFFFRLGFVILNVPVPTRLACQRLGFEGCVSMVLFSLEMRIRDLN